MWLAIWGAAVLAALGGALGWGITDRLERDNGFCVACHLDRGTPLHEAKLNDFTATPPASLAAAHAAADREFLCIGCHDGASAANKLRVKAVAARDAARYLVGWFDEPTSMRHPLWDEDCAQCHASYDSERADDFHALEAHNIDFPYGCVECHRSHSTNAPPRLQFLDRRVVLPICEQCHEE